MANLTIALAGNPNAGKTTIFNSLTGFTNTRETGQERPLRKKKARSNTTI
jgi:50S ribosomal subunit-associated GTPase HflX